MDKLQYDSLYKFLVSLGVIFVALPVAAFVYLLNSEPVLISQSDFDELSEYSWQMIEYKDSMTTFCIDAFPWFCGISICFGVFFLGYGICKWKSVQKNLDKKLDAEATMQVLSLMEMNNNEVESKVEKEVSEVISIEDGNKQPVISETEHLMSRYQEIENICYNYFVAKYSGDYLLKKNIRIGRHCYDFIGVSINSNVDLLVEVKYYRSIEYVSSRLNGVFNRLFDAGKNYKIIAHRDFTLCLVVVTSKEQLPQLKHIVKTYMKQLDNVVLNKINVKCIAEEAL